MEYRNYLLRILILSVTPVTSVADESGLYITGGLVAGLAEVEGFSAGGLSVNTPRDDDVNDAVAGLAAALGYLWSNLRTEVHYVWRHRFDFDNRFGTNPNATGFKTDLRTHSVTLNMLWDFHNDSRFTPYAGLGGGWVHHDADSRLTVIATTATFSNTTTTNDFTWSGIAGVTIDLTDRWKADIGYQYSDLGEVETDPFANGGNISTDS